MPRVARTRTRTRHQAPGPLERAAADGSGRQRPGDIASAPVPLAAAAEEPPEAGRADRGSKKARRVERHQQWVEKMEAAQAARRAERRQQARAADRSALVRGMGALQASIREVQAEGLLLQADHRAAAKPGRGRAGAPMSQKARARAAVREGARFGQVLRHPAFQADALATIREHLANTLGGKPE
ncbi:hypothetical protein H4R18_005952 [Coemansia javaensis]|uniref:Ribosome biogenesis protein SLX9 n=1 Tax=Coemansia javaensis TaxID=2761396 RepID=A0A9W8H4H0_9FUNG|nr:hypothetical protein H4R18_005952 [Coemansia javaensis]